MRYHALATDYDGTLAHHGAVDAPTVAALERLRASGRRLLMVTGRELDQLIQVCPRLDLFDRVVAENGALLYRPANGEELPLAEPPPPRFVAELRRRGVDRVSVGRSIVATWTPHETTVLETIRDLGLELQVIFNKGAVMILPTGVNKATGLARALAELGLSAHNTVGVGDAENDHAFLAACEAGVAVANALPMLKERADLVTDADHGAGVAELIGRLLDDDLRSIESSLSRHDIRLGTLDDGQPATFAPHGLNLLVAGRGASLPATAVLGRLAAAGYQCAVIAPEGGASGVESAVVLGDLHRAPVADEALDLLAHPDQNVVINLVGLAPEHRPAFVADLLPRLQDLRSRVGHPHWVAIREAEHLALTPTRGLLVVADHPDRLAPAVLESVDLVLAVGEHPAATIGAFCAAVGRPAPASPPDKLEPGAALAWWTRSDWPPQRVRT